MANASIPALLPGTANGHQFVLYGDSCSGVPGSAHERNFAAVNAALLRLRPAPEFICFLGDHVMGLTRDAMALRDQWRHFLDREFGAVRAAVPECWHVTSNHSLYDPTSAAVWRETFAELPQNGPPDERGLAYWVRRGTLLLVVVNTARAARNGGGGVASEWVDTILAEHADAAHKLVVGHHPIHPVNGYAEHPKWRVPPQEGERFWATLVRHGVLAYACSHIIAFDAQVHDGVLQITSGGAGTEWGPGGAMPRPPEYQHFVQLAVDARRLALQARDPAGVLRDWLAWPPEEDVPWSELAVPPHGLSLSVPAPASWGEDVGTAHLVTWRFAAWHRTPAATQLLLRAASDDDRHGITIAIEDAAVVVRRSRASNDGVTTATWHAPAIGDATQLDIEIAIHTGMGPGGVLWRGPVPGARWSSARSDSATGFEDFAWCGRWQLGGTLTPGARATADDRQILTWRAALQRFDPPTTGTP